MVNSQKLLSVLPIFPEKSPSTASVNKLVH